jgi:cell division protein FtsL
MRNWIEIPEPEAPSFEFAKKYRKEANTMARQADIQYVEYPVDGTAARKVERYNHNQTAAPVYARRQAARKVIAVDPVALFGIVLAVVMLFAMVVGLAEYRYSLQQTQQMNVRVQQLQQENLQLQQTYQAGYDLEEIERIAMEAGMVPAADMERVRIDMHAPEENETQMSVWDAISNFLTGIFA